MTSFSFSLEQLKAAPPEMRRWVEHEIGAALGALNRFDHDPSQVRSAALATCTPEEALQMFQLIKDNFLLSQVFFRAGARYACRPRCATAACAQHRRAVAPYTSFGR